MPSKVAREGGSEEFQSPMKGGCFEDINGEFSKNREDGKKELERHSGEVYADPDGDVRGAEDRVVQKEREEHFTRKNYVITKCFQERFMGCEQAPSSWRIVRYF